MYHVVRLQVEHGDGLSSSSESNKFTLVYDKIAKLAVKLSQSRYTIM